MESLRCLLIDDRQEEEEFFKIALERSGMPVMFSFESNARIAFQKLLVQEPLPHIIFLDINMPLMNGKEFLVELKKTSRLQHIPVHAYSLGEHDAKAEELLHLGAASYILKPQSIDTMVSLLQQLLTEGLNPPPKR